MKAEQKTPDILMTSLTQLDSFVRSTPYVYVLFYASWCPYSRMFLPVFEKVSKENPGTCARAVVDEDEALWSTYNIRVVPTVLLFENGNVTHRLDGVAGEGLNESELRAFLKDTYRLR